MRYKLLLVDDEAGLRKALGEYLREKKYDVYTASSVEQAWQYLKKDSIDLIISDILMPKENGYQFLLQLRAQYRFRDLPIIFLTAKGLTRDRIEGYKAGCSAYIPKPFDPEELLSIIENLLVRQQEIKQHSLSVAQEVQEVQELLYSFTSSHQGNYKIILTPREQSILNLLVKGFMNKEIALKLHTSLRNVEKYVSRLFSKTSTTSRTELVRIAVEKVLIT